MASEVRRERERESDIHLQGFDGKIGHPRFCSVIIISYFVFYLEHQRRHSSISESYACTVVGNSRRESTELCDRLGCVLLIGIAEYIMLWMHVTHTRHRASESP